MKEEKRKSAFKLTKAAEKALRDNMKALRKGIKNVCEMHTYDSNPSMTQEDFEMLYIEKVLGQPISAVSASLRKLAEDLSKQKEEELMKINKNTEEEGSENFC